MQIQTLKTDEFKICKKDLCVSVKGEQAKIVIGIITFIALTAGIASLAMILKNIPG